MDAIKYMREFKRMCASYEICADCPNSEDKEGCTNPPEKYTDEAILKLVKTVKGWSAAHPVYTRVDALKKIFPDVPTNTFGALFICPTSLDKNFVCGFDRDCAVCLKNYWLKEVQP